MFFFISCAEHEKNLLLFTGENTVTNMCVLGLCRNLVKALSHWTLVKLWTTPYL